MGKVASWIGGDWGNVGAGLLDGRRQGQGGVNVCGVSEVSWEGDLLDGVGGELGR